MPPRVLIVEDHALVSQGLSLMLSRNGDFEIAGVAETGLAALEMVSEGDVDVVLMDVNLGRSLNGIEATKRIKEASPPTRVIVLTMYSDTETVCEAIKAGADGYLSKSASEEFVVWAIREVMEGRQVLDPGVTEGIFGRIGGKGPHALTDRELTALQEMAHGKSTRQIANDMGLSEDTVKTYLKQIFRKLGVHDRAGAVAEGFRRGLVH